MILTTTFHEAATTTLGLRISLPTGFDRKFSMRLTR
jgi:hypothetical protein